MATVWLLQAFGRMFVHLGVYFAFTVQKLRRDSFHVMGEM